MQPRLFLVSERGVRIAVPDLGLLLGRSGACHVVIDDERVSRRHAQIRPTATGAELTPLGRNPVTVNRLPTAQTTPLDPDDVVEIAGRRFRLERQGAAIDACPWSVVDGDLAYGVIRSPFTLGGAPDDDLQIDDLPPGALRLHLAQGALFVETDHDGATLDDAPLAVGEIEAVGDRARVVVGERTLTLRRHAPAEATPTDVAPVYPDRVELRFLSRGGLLTLHFAGTARAVPLAERRLELMAGLLEPPAPLRAGDYVPDAALLQRVWPRRDRADLSDLNVLVHRLRRDLVKAGVNGAALIARQPGGTRFAIHGATELAIVRL